VCTEPATADDVRAAMPHPVAGSAADPIALEPVDDVVVTTLVDNVYDALLTGDDTITRAPLAAGTAQAPQFEAGRTNVGLMAEHGFSALVTVRRGDTTTSVLFDTGLSPDAMVTNSDRLDDQALVANVRGKGLVIVTGCGHAGAVNIARHAQRLTGVPRLHALLGGLHLSGAFFTPSISPTVHALTELAPDLLVPGHCTGWRAQHALAAALPDSWIQGSSGTRYQLTASLPAGARGHRRPVRLTPPDGPVMGGCANRSQRILRYGR
jgi:metal-dependent hydrolase (beta-lactamase superfamily II)